MSTLPPSSMPSSAGATATDPAVRTAAASPADVARAERTVALTREVPRPRRPGWWGMVFFLATDSSMFVSLFGTYYYLEFVSSSERPWPPAADPLPKLLKASILTAIMLVTIVPMLVADLGLKGGHRGRTLAGCAGVALLGAAFSVLEVFEFMDELATSWPTKDAYSSIFYTILGFHLAHVMVLTLFMLLMSVATATGRLDLRHHGIIRIFALFWYASIVLWAVIYAILYWSVRI